MSHTQTDNNKSMLSPQPGETTESYNEIPTDLENPSVVEKTTEPSNFVAKVDSDSTTHAADTSLTTETHTPYLTTPQLDKQHSNDHYGQDTVNNEDSPTASDNLDAVTQSEVLEALHTGNGGSSVQELETNSVHEGGGTAVSETEEPTAESVTPSVSDLEDSLGDEKPDRTDQDPDLTSQDYNETNLRPIFEKIESEVPGGTGEGAAYPGSDYGYPGGGYQHQHLLQPVNQNICGFKGRRTPVSTTTPLCFPCLFPFIDDYSNVYLISFQLISLWTVELC